MQCFLVRTSAIKVFSQLMFGEVEYNLAGYVVLSEMQNTVAEVGCTIQKCSLVTGRFQLNAQVLSIK